MMTCQQSHPVGRGPGNAQAVTFMNQYAVGLTEPNQFTVCCLVVAGSVRSRELAARTEKPADLAFALISLPHPLSVNLTVQDTKGSVASITEHPFFCKSASCPKAQHAAVVNANHSATRSSFDRMNECCSSHPACLMELSGVHASYVNVVWSICWNSCVKQPVWSDFLVFSSCKQRLARVFVFFFLLSWYNNVLHY
jgi:hypothetical protein